MIDPRPIVITGATGFIGSHVARALVKEGYTVHALVREFSTIAALSDIKDDLVFHTLSIMDEDVLKRLFHSLEPQGFFHLAASNIISGRRASDAEVLETNTLGTSSLLNAAREIEYMFFVSMGSFLEYGYKQAPLREEDRCDPIELYSISKLAATLLVQAEGRVQKKPTIAIRLFTPYGPGIQKGRLIYNVLVKAIRGEPIQLSGPEIQRDFIYISDIVDLCLETMERAAKYPGMIFNCGSGKATTMKSLVDTALAVTDSKSSIEWGAFPETEYDRGVWTADMSRTFSHFSWRPMFSVEEGLRQTSSWLTTIGES